MRNFICVLCLTGLLMSCSNRQVYESVKANQQNQCDLLQLEQREECLKHLPPAYNDYERNRKALEKEQMERK